MKSCTNLDKLCDIACNLVYESVVCELCDEISIITNFSNSRKYPTRELLLKYDMVNIQQGNCF